MPRGKKKQLSKESADAALKAAYDAVPSDLIDVYNGVLIARYLLAELPIPSSLCHWMIETANQNLGNR